MPRLDSSPLPPRSRLYPLAPQGMGTPLVESLSSLASRIAAAHCVPVGVLLSRELGPAIASSTFSVGQGWVQVGHTMNGQGEHAKRCVLHLQRLTRQNGLAALTFLATSKILSDTHLLRTKKAWCAQCLSEWKAADQTVYEPLLWACEQVTLCPIHEHPLQDRCPHADCQAWVPLLTSWPGYCPRCTKWLGYVPDHTTVATIDESEREYKRCAAHMVGMILTCSQRDPSLLDPFYLTQALSACAYHVQRLSRKYRKSPIPGYSFSRLKEMSSRVSGIQLDTLLYICHHLRITPLYFLNEYSVASFDMELPPPPVSRQKPRQVQHRPSLHDIGHKFEEILQHRNVPIPSLSEVARRLGTTSQILRVYFKPFCNKLKAIRLGLEDEELRQADNIRKAVQRAAMRPL